MRNLPVFDDPNLIVGTQGFSDAGVVRLRDDLLIVQSLDFFPPLVDDPYVFGQIAAANSLSDIYAMGAQPTTVLNIVGFPDDKLELEILSEILRGGAEQVRSAGAMVIGGHSVRDVEIKYGLSVTGVVSPDDLMTNQNAQPGDVLVLTKALGTGFVTTAFKAGKCPEATFTGACESMTMLNDGASAAARSAKANAVTDITGFGLAGHAGELAQSSNVTVVLEVSRIPILLGAAELAQAGFHTRASASNRQYSKPETKIEGNPDASKLEFLFDPQTSGGLLISVPEDEAEKLVNQACAAGATESCIIGQVVEKQQTSLIIKE